MSGLLGAILKGKPPKKVPPVKPRVMGSSQGNYPGAVMGDEGIMSAKAHGTTEKPVQQNLKYAVDRANADKICCFNRHYAEHSGYAWKTKWISETKDKGEVDYCDSVTGKVLFTAPKGRSFAQFEAESRVRGGAGFNGDASKGRLLLVPS